MKLEAELRQVVVEVAVHESAPLGTTEVAKARWLGHVPTFDLVTNSSMAARRAAISMGHCSGLRASSSGAVGTPLGQGR